jgi:hypothetical protein
LVIERRGRLWYAVFSYLYFPGREEIMLHLIIGAVAAAGFSALLILSRKLGLKVRWWQWGLTFLAFVYSVFVLELVSSFLEEGMGRGALVMGLILGFVALIWGVLLGRFVFKHPTVPGKSASGRKIQ